MTSGCRIKNLDERGNKNLLTAYAVLVPVELHLAGAFGAKAGFQGGGISRSCGFSKIPPNLKHNSSRRVERVVSENCFKGSGKGLWEIYTLPEELGIGSFPGGPAGPKLGRDAKWDKHILPAA